MTNSPTPIFLFSLPRSGSTLVQRIFGADPAISTAAEPHLLLPHLYSLRFRGMYAEYDQTLVAEALRDFCAVLPLGRDDYLAELALFASRIYAKASAPGTTYFLDKTPRYHLIANEICQMFENGRFIVLWRNPLAIVASLMERFADGRWNLYKYKIDLFDGLQNLIQTYQSHEKQVCSVKYEDIIADPETQFRKLFQYVGLPFNPSVLVGFNNVFLKGQHFDHVSTKRYQLISSEPLERWRTTLSSPFRKAWCRRYLKWIGRHRLAVMGYELDSLLEDLDSIPSTYRNSALDLVRASYGVAYCALEPRIIKHKATIWTDWRRMHAHL